MKKSYPISLAIVTMLFFSSMLVLLAQGETILETWRNPQTGSEVFVNPYNHDNSVYKGPEYQAKILELIIKGFVHKNYSITENSGGCGNAFDSYEESYVLTTIKKLSTDEKDESYYYISRFLKGRSEQTQTADGFFVNGEWVDIDEEWYGENIDLDDIKVDGHFTGRQIHSEGRIGLYSYNWTMSLPDSTRKEGTIYVIREDIDETHTRWHIGDDIEGILMIPSIPPDWDDLVVEGVEENKIRTIYFEIPQGSAGPPQLSSLYYGIQILGTLYGPQSIDEIPEELMIYVKEINGQYYTYSGSPLDIWIYENIYKPNHAKSYIE